MNKNKLYGKFIKFIKYIFISNKNEYYNDKENKNKIKIYPYEIEPDFDISANLFIPEKKIKTIIVTDIMTQKDIKISKEFFSRIQNNQNIFIIKK